MPEESKKASVTRANDGDTKDTPMDIDVFTSLEFKQLVSEPNSQSSKQGLLRFAKASESFDSRTKGSHDIVKSYISSSPDCTEILQCLRGQSSPGEIGSVFCCLINILSRTASDLKELYEKVGKNVCDAITQSHLQKVYHALGLHQSPRTIVNTLKMLTMLVMQGAENARDLSNQIDFSMKCFKDVLNRFKGKFAYEIRISYIRFALSFFMSNDSKAIQRILETRGFVSNIFEGLPKDTASTVQLVFTTIKEKAITNPFVSKTARARFFAEHKLLKNITKVFGWDGIFDIEVKDEMELSGKEFVRNIVYEFLYHATCPFKYGINFLDKSLGIGENCKNHVLLDFILHLLPLTGDTLIQKLVVEILKACPDLLPRFLKDFRASLEPRIDDVWNRNCELVKKVYENQPDVATALTSVLLKNQRHHEQQIEKVDLDTLLKMTLPGLISPNFSCFPVLKHCMKSKSVDIKIKALNLLLIFMKKIQASMEFIAKTENWDKSLYSEEDMEIFSAKLEDFLLENQISVSFIVQLWKENVSEGVDTIKGLLLKLLTFCQKLFPEEIRDAKFDFTRLLDGLKFQAVISDVSPNIKTLVIEMLSEAPHLYKWFKVYEGNTPFKKLLQLIYNCPKSSEDFYKKVEFLFQRILICNGILHRSEHGEAAVWMQHLVPKVRTQNDDALLNYIASICSKIVRMPMNYFEILAAQKYGSNVEVDQSFWDSLPDVKIESASEKDWMQLAAKQLSQNIGSLETDTSQHHDCMSLLAVAALDGLKDTSSLVSEEKGVLSEYLTKVFMHLFNASQNVANATFSAQIFETCTSKVQKFDNEYSSLHNFGVFLSAWLKKEPAGTYRGSNDTIIELLQNWLWKISRGEKITKKSSLLKLLTSRYLCDDITIQDVGLTISQCLLYFDTLYQNGIDAHPAACRELLASIMYLLTKLDDIAPRKDGDTATDELIGYSDQVKDIWKHILQNVTVQSLFFKDVHLEYDSQSDYCNPNLEESVKDKVSLTTLCTSLATGLILKRSWNEWGHENLFKVYTSKVVQSISSFVEDLLSCKLSFDENTLLLLRVYKDTQTFFSAQQLQSVFVSLTSLLNQVKSKPVAGLVIKLICVSIEGLVRHGPGDTPFFYEGIQYIFKFFGSKFMKKSDRLITALISLLNEVPSLAVTATDTLVKSLIKSIGSEKAKLLSELVQKNPVLLINCLKGDFFAKMELDAKILFIPFVNQILNTFVTNYGENSISDIKSIVDAYWPLLRSQKQWQQISQVLTSEVGKKFMKNLLIAGVILGKSEDISQLLTTLVGDDAAFLELKEPLSFIEASLAALEKTAHFHCAQVLVILLLQRLVCNPHCGINPIALFCLVNGILQNLDPKDHSGVAQKVCPKWPKFVKTVLKQHFECAEGIHCIIELVRLQYACDGVCRDPSCGTKIETLKEMLVSHSKFLPSILKMEQACSDKDGLKAAILELHYEITLRCKAENLYDADLGYLLGAYGATLSLSGQIVIRTILMYERKGVSFTGMKPFLWGPNALSSYRARKNLGENLWKKPGSTEVLSCIDSQIMDASLSRFPIRRRMLSIEGDAVDVTYFENDRYGTIFASKNEILAKPDSSQMVYDPCFLLPSFLCLLNPEDLVDCKAFVRTGALSFLMCSLSSHCPMIRSLAANCLSLYYQHAQTAWFPENNLVMYLIRCVRNSMGTKEDEKGELSSIVKLPSVVANFLATIVKLHSKPADHMFSVLHRFLLVKPELDLKNIPEFYVLFFSAEMESKIERTWVLNLISEGFRDMGDYHTVNRRNTMQLLFCLHDSPISDNYSRRQVFEILERACSIRSAAFDLVKNHGLVSWLMIAASNQLLKADGYSRIVQTVGSPGKRQENTTHIIRVMSVLWKSLDTSKFVAMDKMEVDDDGQEDEANDLKREKHIAVVPFRIVKQIICLSVALLHNISSSCNEFNDFESNFCEEALDVLTSCLSNLHNRNKLSSKRIVNGQPNGSVNEDSLLSNEDVKILLSLVDELLKCARSNAVCALMKVLTFWTAGGIPFDNELKRLWEYSVDSMMRKSMHLWSVNSTWVQENCLNLLEWLNKWVDKLEHGWNFNDKGVLVRLYDVICCNREILAEDFFRCLSILNAILAGESVKNDSSYSDIMSKMKGIRLGILVSN